MRDPLAERVGRLEKTVDLLLRSVPPATREAPHSWADAVRRGGCSGGGRRAEGPKTRPPSNPTAGDVKTPTGGGEGGAPSLGSPSPNSESSSSSSPPWRVKKKKGNGRKKGTGVRSSGTGVSTRPLVSEEEGTPNRAPMCYRCLRRGHLARACSSDPDYGNRCYRCGTPGHVAWGCRAPMRCPVCVDAGCPSGHIAGSGACSPPHRKVGRKKEGDPPPSFVPPSSGGTVPGVLWTPGDYGGGHQHLYPPPWGWGAYCPHPWDGRGPWGGFYPTQSVAPT